MVTDRSCWWCSWLAAVTFAVHLYGGLRNIAIVTLAIYTPSYTKLLQTVQALPPLSTNAVNEIFFQTMAYSFGLLVCFYAAHVGDMEKSCGSSSPLLRTLGLLLIGFGVPWAAELISHQYDFPFGAYALDSRFGVQFAGVALSIPLMWFSFLYPTYVAGRKLSRLLGKNPSVWGPILGAALATLSDMVSEPHLCSIGLSAYGRVSIDPTLLDNPSLLYDPMVVWQADCLDTVCFQRVPISNFLGWIITALSTGIAWTCFRVQPPSRSRWFVGLANEGSLPILLHACTVGFYALHPANLPIPRILSALLAIGLIAVWVAREPCAFDFKKQK